MPGTRRVAEHAHRDSLRGLAGRKQYTVGIHALVARVAARNNNSGSCPLASSLYPLPPLAGDGVPVVKFESQANNVPPSQCSLPPLAWGGVPSVYYCVVQVNIFQPSTCDCVEVGVIILVAQLVWHVTIVMLFRKRLKQASILAW